MKKKKKNKAFIILMLFFLSYIIVLFTYNNGYIEYKSHTKMTLTKEAMERFEEDVNSGKNISINDYITPDHKDYSNNASKLGAKTGQYLEEFMTKGVIDVVKVLKKFFAN